MTWVVRIDATAFSPKLNYETQERGLQALNSIANGIGAYNAAGFTVTLTDDFKKTWLLRAAEIRFVSLSWDDGDEVEALTFSGYA